MGRKQKLKLQRKIERKQVADKENKRKKKKMFAAVALLLVAFAVYQVNVTLKSSRDITTANPIENNNQNKENKIAIIETDRGNIKLELYTKDAPKTVENFVKLANKKFYNGTKFHRVVPGFVIQGGDPLSKNDNPSDDGTGGPGYTFEDEINPWSLGLNESVINSYKAQGYKYRKDLTSHKVTVGSLAMANSGPNTNGSQFFIVTEKDQPHLDGKHTVFGRVIEGMDVVRRIKEGDTMNNVYIVKRFLKSN